MRHIFYTVHKLYEYIYIYKKNDVISFELHLSIRDVRLVQTNLCSTIFSVGYNMKRLSNLIISF